MMRVKIEDVCMKGSSNLKQSDVVGKNGIYPVYGAAGYLGSIDSFKQSKPYVAVVKDGAGIGRAMLLPSNSSIIGTMQYLLPKDNILPEYLYYLIKAKHLEKYYSGATIPHIYFKDYKNEEFDLFSFEIQYQIINKLKIIEKIIEKQKKEMDLLDELVKARFVELFGDIISNDKNWNSKPLKELCDISRGASPRPISDYLGGTIPWIKIGDATIGDSIYINLTKEHIIKEGVRKSRFIKKGSLIFANCGVSLGFCRIINFDGCIHDGWLAFQNIDTSLNKIFLLTTINQMTGYFRKIAPGGTQPNLNTDIVGNYIQVVPPLELQNQFADFVKEVDKSRLEVQKSLKKTQELFDSLMQKYFG